MTGAYLATEPNESPSHRLGHAGIINYARLSYPESSKTDYLRFMLLDLFGPDPPEDDTVRSASLFQRCEARQFVGTDRHHQLSAAASRDALLSTEAVHGFQAGAAHPRLEGPGFVVETGVDDAAVMPRLMLGESVFRLQDHWGVPTLGKSEGRCNPDDSAAHHNRAIGP